MGPQMLRRLALASSVVLLAPLLGVASEAARLPPYTVRSLTVTASIAPEGALGSTHCAIDADLYTPRGVSRGRPAPAILTTHGFGGSKADGGGLARTYAARGYVVLSYSGLGLGAAPDKSRRGSDCKITFDDRDHDGLAGSALIDFLGGGRRADDGTRVDYVLRDARAHDGRRYSHDPRVGMIGMSYGGAAQFAVAAVDPRLDTIVPMVTWNDLAYSVSPNNTTLAPGTVRNSVPGTQKIRWATQFLGYGAAYGASGHASTNGRTGTCAGVYEPLCQSFSSLEALGYADRTAMDVMRNASVSSFGDGIRVPVLLMQGQGDSLFPLREAAATYTRLRARHVPVKMVWHRWGHDATPSPTEFTWSGGGHLGRLTDRWFAYWLRGEGPRPALDFSYYRGWLDASDAGRTYASAPSYPLRGTTKLYATGTTLVARSTHLTSGATVITTTGALPTSASSSYPVNNDRATTDGPGSATGWRTLPLRDDVVVVGAPSARLRLSSTTAQSTRPEAMLVAFVKIYDVAPDGTRTLPYELVAPIRVADLRKPVDVALPAIVHRFAKGHRIELMVALSDAAYRGNAQAQVVTLSTSQRSPTILTLPGVVPTRAFGG